MMRTAGVRQCAIQVLLTDLEMLGILTTRRGYHGNGMCWGKWYNDFATERMIPSNAESMANGPADTRYGFDDLVEQVGNTVRVCEP